MRLCIFRLTETSPVVNANALTDTDPFSVGSPLEDVEARIGDNDELLVKGSGVMLGYWGDPMKDGYTPATSITSRIKGIIVMADGEKIVEKVWTRDYPRSTLRASDGDGTRSGLPECERRARPRTLVEA